ncbi:MULTISPECIES: MinD/ParA family ATP-binding protein [Streptomyces]|uniref:MinD/ParA family ATP-binding protein n=2 Tax=Streptomyces TaxID=1883 RepID=UPI00163B77BD|nr:MULTISPECIES: MinD/ParA family protein [Streptomyces]WTD49240.1 MinD/ParA family protein [Streptomyces thermoviolaceus]GGV59951.1 hypothetical protein GCM10010499_00080 [Streptomyces thermoviolaceus subsp. apingens]GHB13141.1 hypothetical protein GCM10010512_50690 [Streptomyces thermoviolaceus subsp. thermoviolaceus]
MPNGENWQSDVLRDLRSGGGTSGRGPQEAGRAPHQAPQAAGQAGQDGHPDATPRPGTPAAGVPAQQQAQGQPQHGAAAPAYGYPHQPQPHQQHFPQAGAHQPYPAQYQAQQAAQQQAHQAQQAYQAPQPHQPYTAPAQEAHQAQAQPAYAPAPGAAPQPQPAAVPHQQPAGHAARSPRATPDSRPVVDKQLAAAGVKPRHGEPFARRALRAVRRTVSSSAAREVADTTATAEVLQQPVTTGRQIAVTSIRGGSGKTTVTALLGTTYAHYRQDPVLVVEADPALGSLPLRLGAETLRWTTGDLAGIVEPQMSLLDVTGYLVQLPDNAWLLPGSQGQVGAMLDTKGYERVMVALRRYFGVTVVDCETLPAEVARTALSAAQARVLTVPATLEGIASTHAVLEWMRALPRDITTSTVVVLTETVPHTGLDLDKAAEQLKATGASVRVLPYDRHLAAGGTIRTDLLAQATRQAVTRLAAEVFQLSHKRR